MADLRPELRREIDRIPPSDYPIEAVARRVDRRRRARRIGGGIVGIAVALLAAATVLRALPHGDESVPADARRERLVFVSPGFGDLEDRLVTASPQGTDIQRIAVDIHAEYPEWSADGRFIAFDDGQNLTGSQLPIPNGDIYVMNADGSGLRIVPLVGEASAPSWSPDGSRVAVAASRPGRAPGIAWLDLDSGDLTPVTTNPYQGWWDAEPAVSPDGTLIAFIRVKGLIERGGQRNLAALFVVNDDGSGLRRLTSWRTDAGTPDWSPDGTRIAFNSSDHFGSRATQIEVIDADGSGRQTLTDGGAGIRSFWPTWSPDGSAIAFTRIDEQLLEPARLYLVPSSGGEALPSSLIQALNQADWGLAP